MRLPSRNWCIFLGVVGGWTAAVMYDRRQTKRIQKKWTKLVEHIAHETLNEHQMPRKLTIYLAAPPADGLMAARDHFNEYVKPILVAAAMDWDAIEGRREGDVRAGLAERIRVLRKKRGESTKEPLELGQAEVIEDMRQRVGIRDWDGPGGDVIIGRHAWKEYVRGLHEGWLGPLDNPRPVVEEPAADATSTPAPQVTPDAHIDTIPSTDGASPTATPAEDKQAEPEKPKEEEKKPKKKPQTPPFNTPLEYQESNLPPTCPQALGPSTVIPLPHLLGFFNFPIRMYRFLYRRQVADDVGRQTVAAVLGAYRPFHTEAENTMAAENAAGSSTWEQKGLLAHEEPDWHKSITKRTEEDDKERVWLDDMVIDPRIGDRMRRFEVDTEAEERANRPVEEEKKDSWFTSLWPKKEKKAWEGLTDDEL
jgi:import inner membrane translocase subunit TIM54